MNNKNIMKSISSLISAVAFLIVAVIGWQVYSVFDEQMSVAREKLRQVEEENTQLRDTNQKLEMANVLLKRSCRLATISDIKSEKDANTGAFKTSFSFTERDLADQPIGEKRMFTINGNVLYIDTLIIKFEDDYIEGNDALRGCSLFLFRRLFSEKQKPEEGFPLDVEGKTPQPYIVDAPDMAEFQNKLWADFWKLAQDPELAKKYGVRAAHGSAPYMQLEEGATYKLEMRSTGELTFVREQNL